MGEEDTSNSVRRELIQDSSAALFAKARCSTPVDDLATDLRLVDFLEMSLEP